MRLVEAGRADGQKAGAADGFAEGKKDAETDGRNETLLDLYDTDNYRTDVVANIAYVGSAFLVGFITQYVLFYLLRRIGLLHDIDLLVLSGETIDDLTAREQRG